MGNVPPAKLGDEVVDATGWSDHASLIGRPHAFSAYPRYATCTQYQQAAILPDCCGPDRRERRDSIHNAAFRGHAAAVEAFLKDGVAPSASDTCTTPLHLACWEGHVVVVEMLLAAGADCNARDSFLGWTPLHLAARRGALKCAELLLQSGGTDASAPDLAGWAPLHFAAFYGWADVASILLTHGANKDSCTFRGELPLRFASDQGHPIVVDVLMGHGAKLYPPGTRFPPPQRQDSSAESEVPQTDGPSRPAASAEAPAAVQQEAAQPSESYQDSSKVEQLLSAPGMPTSQAAVHARQRQQRLQKALDIEVRYEQLPYSIRRLLQSNEPDEEPNSYLPVPKTAGYIAGLLRPDPITNAPPTSELYGSKLKSSPRLPSPSLVGRPSPTHTNGSHTTLELSAPNSPSCPPLNSFSGNRRVYSPAGSLSGSPRLDISTQPAMGFQSNRPSMRPHSIQSSLGAAKRSPGQLVRGAGVATSVQEPSGSQSSETAPLSPSCRSDDSTLSVGSVGNPQNDLAVSMGEPARRPRARRRW
jgi:hypothetical protein